MNSGYYLCYLSPHRSQKFKGNFRKPEVVLFMFQKPHCKGWDKGLVQLPRMGSAWVSHLYHQNIERWQFSKMRKPNSTHGFESPSSSLGFSDNRVFSVSLETHQLFELYLKSCFRMDFMASTTWDWKSFFLVLSSMPFLLLLSLSSSSPSSAGSGSQRH